MNDKNKRTSKMINSFKGEIRNSMNIRCEYGNPALFKEQNSEYSLSKTDLHITSM